MAANAAHTAQSPAVPAKRRKEEPLWTKDFVFGTVTNFVLSCNYFMLTVVMTAYAMDVYGAPASLAAFCASIFIVGTLFARVTSPKLMQKLGRKPLLFAGAIADCLLTGLYLVDAPLALLMGIRLLHGFSYGTCSTTIATMVTAAIPPARKGEGIGYYMLSVTLGAAIGPFAGILLSRHLSYETLFFASAAIILVALPCIAILKPGRRTVTAAQAEEAESADELQGSVEGAREAAAALRPEPVRRGRLDAVVERSAVPISLVSALIFFGYSALLTFLNPYAETIGLTRAASVFFIVYAFAMFLTRPFTGRAFDRRGPTLVMAPAFFSFSAGMLVLAFAGNDWMILGSALLCGYGVGTIQSCGLAMAVKAAPDDRLSTANATFYICLDVGVGVGPLILGAFVPVIGYPLLYVAMAVVGMAAFAAFLFVRRSYGRA